MQQFKRYIWVCDTNWATDQRERLVSQINYDIALEELRYKGRRNAHESSGLERSIEIGLRIIDIDKLKHLVVEEDERSIDLSRYQYIAFSVVVIIITIRALFRDIETIEII